MLYLQAAWLDWDWRSKLFIFWRPESILWTQTPPSSFHSIRSHTGVKRKEKKRLTYTDYFRIMLSLQLARYLDIFILEKANTTGRRFCEKKESTYSKLILLSADGWNLSFFFFRSKSICLQHTDGYFTPRCYPSHLQKMLPNQNSQKRQSLIGLRSPSYPLGEVSRPWPFCVSERLL